MCESEYAGTAFNPSVLHTTESPKWGLLYFFPNFELWCDFLKPTQAMKSKTTDRFPNYWVNLFSPPNFHVAYIRTYVLYVVCVVCCVHMKIHTQKETITEVTATVGGSIIYSAFVCTHSTLKTKNGIRVFLEHDGTVLDDVTGRPGVLNQSENCRHHSLLPAYATLTCRIIHDRRLDGLLKYYDVMDRDQDAVATKGLLRMTEREVLVRDEYFYAVGRQCY